MKTQHITRNGKRFFAPAIFTAALALATATAAQEAEAAAQETEAVEQTVDAKRLDTTKTYSLRGGINFSSALGLDNVVGFHIGGMMDMPLMLADIGGYPYLFEVHPGVQFIKKGGERSYGFLLYSSSKHELDAYYLEVPVPFSMKRKFSESVAARVDLGPYVAFGLFGTHKIKEEATRSWFGVSNPGSDYSGSAFSNRGLSRLDIGLIYGIAVDFAKNYNLALHFSTGLNGDSVSSFYMTLGYKL